MATCSSVDEISCDGPLDRDGPLLQYLSGCSQGLAATFQHWSNGRPEPREATATIYRWAEEERGERGYKSRSHMHGREDA